MSEMGTIAAKLISLRDRDLDVRQRLLDDGTLFDGYHPEMEAVHRENAATLREIIDEIGWPTRSKVGDEASDAAWLIAQHSIGEPQFMRAAFEMLMDAADDVDPKHIAYMHDRICYFEGRPQRYGTQFDERMHPVEDVAAVNELRASIGLPPHAIETIVGPEDVDPDQVRRDDVDGWRRRVGWVK